MPHMSGGGGGGNGGPITVSAAAHQKGARALGRAALDAIRAHILDSNEFVEQLANRLRITFRGEVTAVDRDNTGKNRVYIKRTGKSAADPAPYRIWGSKMVPRVGDDLLLMRLDTGSNVLVLAGADGNHPNDLDVAYAGGAIRLNDSTLLPVQKHGDDHNSRHYATNGTTIVHHVNSNGEMKAAAGIYYSGGTGAGGISIADDGTASGEYQKQHHNTSTGEHEHHMNLGDGEGERLAKTMSKDQHNTHLDDGSGTGTQINTHREEKSGNGGATGHKQNGSSNFHFTGEKGDGQFHVRHASGNLVQTHDGTVARHWGSNKVGLKTDGFATRIYDAGQSDEQAGGESVVLLTSGANQGITGGAGGYIAFRRHSGGAEHSIRDDGADSIEHVHASGHTTHKHDGNTHKTFAQGLEAIVHDGTDLIHKSAGTEKARLSQQNGGGMVKIVASVGGHHIFAEDTNNEPMVQSPKAKVHIKPANAASVHQFTSSGTGTGDHIHPAGGRINSPSSDRLDVLDSSNAAGGIKQNSHSTNVTLDDQPATIPLMPGVVIQHIAAGGYDDPHFKITQHILYYVTNTGTYVHANPHPGENSGYGANTVGSSSGYAYWAETETNGDNSTTIYGATTGAHPAWAGRSVQRNFGINP